MPGVQGSRATFSDTTIRRGPFPSPFSVCSLRSDHELLQAEDGKAPRRIKLAAVDGCFPFHDGNTPAKRTADNFLYPASARGEERREATVVSGDSHREFDI
jgi:hypothetical protein